MAGRGLARRAGRYWWLHTLALLIFLPLIPHTKHLHLALSPGDGVSASAQGFSRIPPLAGDEDFGLDTGKDVTRIDALQAFTCVECGRCTEHCPAYNTGKVLNPKEIVLGLRGYLNEFGPGDEAPLLGKHISEEAAFQCTTCGGCEFQCPVGIQHLPMIIGLRRGAVNTGKWEDDYGTKLFLNLERNGNALGFAASERQKFIEKNALPYLRRHAGILPVAGLHGRVRSAGPRDRAGAGARAAPCRRDLRRAAQGEVHGRSGAPPGQRPGILAGGREPTSKRCARPRSARWSRSARIACAPSGRTGGSAGATFEIEHHSELLARLQDAAARAPRGAREKVVFHDPCYLGRYRDVYEEPRAVIAQYGERGGAGARARALVLLRRRRRADVPRRGEGQARERRRARKNWWRRARR